MNKAFGMPAMILFQHGGALTFAVIDRRLNKLDESKDVLLKATLIKDINFADPHRAHIDILSDLSIDELYEKHKFTNFPELHEAWKKTLDTSELNKRFYKEIADWYFWAVNQVTFPEGAEKNEEVRNKTSMIRLITRLIFVWFIKEKGLVPDDLFNYDKIRDILTTVGPKESTYYKAILQNLFFATLNQEMNTEQKPANRKFRHLAKNDTGRAQHYMVHSLYRYENYFKDQTRALTLFDKIPFLNGGLFECLDRRLDDDSKQDGSKDIRIDGFSDRPSNPLHVPNLLFFTIDETADSNSANDATDKQYAMRGLIDILSKYKFTVTENTPIEVEVALDPELLGKVFENLLAEYNPDTDTTARKQTGSYYTPREIVNHMTDESLVAYLKNRYYVYQESQDSVCVIIPPAQLDLGGREESVQTQMNTQEMTVSGEQKDVLEQKLRNLISYNSKPHEFNEDEAGALITAIDSIKILDPACGSGAFPMGVLHKLVLVLGKLDPRNQKWRQRQIDKVRRTIETAEEIEDSTVRENTIDDLESEISNINDAFERNELDYGRKLYLIENCIYGVDIQPIAVQIAKLRFFISLVVDQKIDRRKENLGVRPLPNLETRFVAADTLIGVDKPAQMPIRNPNIDLKEKDLAVVRQKHFTARTPQTKEKYRKLDRKLRKELSELLANDGFPRETTQRIAFWDLYDQNTGADWFDPEWMFNTRDGFDVVIGNPPYVQLQKNGGKLGRLYAPCNFDAFVRTGDIYCLFYEKANQLSKDGGHVCFITSNKWMRARYGKKLREYLFQNTQPVQLLDMGPDVFDAAVDTNILLLQSVLPESSMAFKAAAIKSDFDKQAGSIAQYLNDNGMSMEMPAKAEPWAILSPAKLALRRKIEGVGKPLKDWDINIHYGIKTGCNEAFIINEVKREELIARDPRSDEIIKPFLRGRDIKRYHIQWSGLYILATEYNLDIPNKYPAIYNHLETVGEQIESRRTKAKGKGLFNRDDQGENWWNLRACAYYSEFEKEKVVYPETTLSANFFYDDERHFIEKTCFMITGSDLKILVGLLSSTLMTFAYRHYYSGTVLGNKGYQYNKHALEKLPIVTIPAAEQRSFITLVDRILDAKRADSDADVSELESDIDQVVYSLYNLTAEEIAIVEENTV